jgi:hypothetical protein
MRATLSDPVARVPTASSSVASIGYSPGTLEVQFRSGAVYRFFEVPRAIYESFLAAPSKGAFFNESVKGRFGYARV